MRIVSGTKDEIVDQLNDLCDGWDHLENRVQLAKAEDGLQAVLDGASTVTVGHTTFTVVDDHQ
jgi:hypothetical protein